MHANKHPHAPLPTDRAMLLRPRSLAARLRCLYLMHCKWTGKFRGGMSPSGRYTRFFFALLCAPRRRA